jgi:predicted nucleotidyltransferase
MPPFLGVVLLGSFARGEADDLSDVDFTVYAAEGDFEAAWEHSSILFSRA